MIYAINHLSPRPCNRFFVNHSCNMKNEYTRILGIKKEPYGSDVKNIK